MMLSREGDLSKRVQEREISPSTITHLTHTPLHHLSHQHMTLPVALDASAEERDSLALTSMMQYSSLYGLSAYWMLHSPTMPRLRMTCRHRCEAIRYDDYSCYLNSDMAIL
jgi:hypothetical protein